MSNPLLTIVTPSYNQGPFIRETIESVLSQDYPNIEYIIMDGGSTDETAAIASEYSSRLTFISEPDRGQSHAINKGFRRAKGEILAWLNSDDVFLPGAVGAAVKGFLEKPGAGIVYGDGFLMDRAGNFKSRFPYTQRFDLYRLAQLSDYILQQSVFIRKSVLEEAGYLREDLHYALDWDLWIRIGKRYPLHYVPFYFGAIREYADAKSSAGGFQRIREIGGVLREHTGRLIPPGWILYGMETAGRRCLERIGGRHGVLADLLKLLVTVLCGLTVRLTVNWNQGWFHDDWAANSFHYWLPMGEGNLVLKGFMPDNPTLLGQQIRVLGNGELLGVFNLQPGRFRLEIPVSSPWRILRLEIQASRTHVPEIKDMRRLSYVLDSIGWQDYGYGPPPPPPAET
jgi:glycosyltransferase involved in cell wall biosynthesis